MTLSQRLARRLVTISCALLLPVAAGAAGHHGHGKSKDHDAYASEEAPDAAPDVPGEGGRRIEARGVDANEVRRILEKYRQEPSIRATQEAAIRYAEFDPDRISSWRTRARVAALGPEIAGDYRKNIENDRTFGAQTSGNVDYSATDDDDRYAARAKWEFDRLIFNPDELRVASETTDLVKLREDVLDQVTKLYFERRRLQVEVETAPPADVGTRLKKELRLQELTAAIDALTGGWFSQQLEQHGTARN